MHSSVCTPMASKEVEGDHDSLAPLVGAKSKVLHFFRFKVNAKGHQLNSNELFCRLCKGYLA